VQSLDPAANEVVTDFETYRAALVNVIPAQSAAKIAIDAGLTDASGFCPVDAFTMKSRMDAHIYVVGDACIPGDMPESAFAANSQAKVAAMSVRGELSGARTFPAHFASSCWSLIETDDCVKVGGRYEPTPEKIKEIDSFVPSRPTAPNCGHRTTGNRSDGTPGSRRTCFPDPSEGTQPERNIKPPRRRAPLPCLGCAFQHPAFCVDADARRHPPEF
jgi:hypothetical protein